MTWGRGPLGHGVNGDCPEPSVVTGLLGLQIDQVASGATFFCALDSDGKVFSWGSGPNGELGHGKAITELTTPRCIVSLMFKKVLQIACGYFHTVALCEDRIP